MIRWLAGLLLCLSLHSPALDAAGGTAQRLESIKQHALALNTLSLSNPRRFSTDTIVLLVHGNRTHRPRHLRIWLNGETWFDYHYGDAEGRDLQSGSSQFLGIAPLPAGSHTVRVELQLEAQRAGRPEAVTLREQAQVPLSAWPRGLSIELGSGPTGLAQLQIRPQAAGAQLLRAAEHALAMGLPGRALSILQTLAQFSPGLTQDPRHTLLMGRALRAWGLDAAAEGMFAQLSAGRATDAQQAEARLQAAELALRQQKLDAAQRYLDWPDKRWSPEQLALARILENRLLLAQGRVADASARVPEQAPPLRIYNLAVAMLAAGQATAGAQLLERIGREVAVDAQAVAVRDLANLKLGYWLLDQRQAESAGKVFDRVSAGSPQHANALLGRGWAALAALEAGNSPDIKDDGLRPRFIQRIDSIMQGMDGKDGRRKKARDAAILDAIEAWSTLRDLDPMEQAVQEAMVAIPYVLGQLGQDQRAIEYGDQAIARLDALRAGLSRIYTRSIKGQLVDAEELSAAAWPPQRLTWRQWTSTTPWWTAAVPEVPLDAHMRHLLTDGETLRILHNMSVLREAEAMVRGAAESPDLSLRANQLLGRIQSERGLQQRALNRYIWTWLDRHGTHTTRYLIMARLIVGQIRSRQARP